jgi:RHS repeat-associated protein
LLYKSVSVSGEVVEWYELKYDVEGNVVERKDANGNTTIFDYYLNTGLLKTSSVKVGLDTFTTTFSYDSNGNLEYKTNPDGGVTTFTREESGTGNVADKQNPNKVSTSYFYDSFNRITSVATGLFDGSEGTITNYFYNENGDLIRILDSKGNITSFEYDKVGQMIKRTSPLNQSIELDYDGNGNVIWEKTPNGHVKINEYDDEDRIISKKISGGKNYSFGYDDNGNVNFISDVDTIVELEYEKKGNKYVLKSEKSSYNNAHGVNLEFQNNERGQRVSMVAGDVGTFTYGYDNGGRLTSIINHKNEEFLFDYDSANRLRRITRPGSVSDLYFDANSFVTSIVHAKPGFQAFSQLNYTRDLVGNRTSMHSMWEKKTYSYDHDSQLTNVYAGIESQGDTLQSVESFTYDSLGNRTSDQNGSYGYDLKSQRLEEDFFWNYYYDNNGNMILKSKKGDIKTFFRYTYNPENQLTRMEEYASDNLVKEIVYRYDALGRRFEKLVLSGSTSRKTNWIYDGQEILAEYINDNLGAIYTQSTMRTDDTLAVDIKATELATKLGSYYYHKDGLGSVIDISDSNGHLIQHYQYSSFGEILKIINSTGQEVTNDAPVKTAYSFTNREWDKDLNMYYYRARYYAANIGRFVSEDSFAGILSLPYTLLTKYAYGYNNSQSVADPMGQDGWNIDPNTYHGNWCGWENKDNDIYDDYEKPPISYRDRTCREHDKGLYTADLFGNLYVDLKFSWDMLTNPESWKNENGNYTLRDFGEAMLYGVGMLVVAVFRFVKNLFLAIKEELSSWKIDIGIHGINLRKFRIKIW